MVWILAGKKYDTDKMEFLSEVKKWYKDELFSCLYEREVGREFVCKLYRSSKGNFLITHEESGKIIGEAINESEAKRLLMSGSYKKYEEVFGEIEEA